MRLRRYSWRRIPDDAGFEALWSIHPETFHEIKMHGRPVKTPRWQQAYGADYRYTGSTNRALPLVPPMPAWLAWARERFDSRLSGLLLNWYDGAAGHYIGRHRDSDVNRIEGSSIVTLSLGEARAFRMRPWRAEGHARRPRRVCEHLGHRGQLRQLSHHHRLPGPRLPLQPCREAHRSAAGLAGGSRMA